MSRSLHLIILWCLFPLFLSAQVWQATSGPAGGSVSVVVVHPNDTAVMYAGGSAYGLFKTLDYGDHWQFVPFGDVEVFSPIHQIIINQNNPDIIIAASGSDIIRSVDGAATWHRIGEQEGIPDYHASAIAMECDPLQPNIIYLSGISHDNEQGPNVYMSHNAGESWTAIGDPLNLPYGLTIEYIAPIASGELFVAVNPEGGITGWNRGRVYYTANNGLSWNEIDYGTQGEMLVAVHACAFDRNQVWIMEIDIENKIPNVNIAHFSDDGGATWTAKDHGDIFTDAGFRPLASSPVASGQHDFYFAAGGEVYRTSDAMATIENISCHDSILRNDLRTLLVQASNPHKLFLSTRANGVAYSEDNGQNWSLKNDGILATAINLLSIDKNNAGTLYCASSKGEGLFKSEDYGESWVIQNSRGIVHQWADELLVDPTNSDITWFVSDVPYIHRTRNGGNSWQVLNNPYEPGDFGFSSVYTIGQSDDNNTIYASNHGFGIFKGTRSEEEQAVYNWSYLNRSDIDYTYTLAVQPDNADIIFSGYSKKPFETHSKVRASYDGGENWETVLDVECEAITSVEIDPLDVNKVMAASIGTQGGQLWLSDDKGQSWDSLNTHFNFTTIHAFDALGDVAYAATWGGGMYKTTDRGVSWHKLEAEESFSAMSVNIYGTSGDSVIIGDRSKPLVYRSRDGGLSWDTIYNAGADYRRIMALTLDTHGRERFYVSAMKYGGRGMEGDLIAVENGKTPEIITQDLPRLVIDIEVSPSDADKLYVTVHESGVYRSSDAGASWQDISGHSRGLPVAGFNGLVINPNDETLYLLGGSDIRAFNAESAGLDPDSVMGVYKSTDDGASWTRINGGTLGEASGSVKSLEFYNGSTDTLFIGTENGVYTSINGGLDWNQEMELPYKTLGGIALSGASVYGFTHGAAVFSGTIEDDLSVTWQKEAPFKAEIAFAQILKHPTEANTLFASAFPGGIFKSEDYGATWHERNFGLPSFKVDDPLREGYYAITINASNPDRMYLGLFNKGIYRSNNGGDTWYPVNGASQEMAQVPITAIVSDHWDANTVYVAALDGIYRSTNGGYTWHSFAQGLGDINKEVKSLNLSPGGVLTAGTKGYGLYTYSFEAEQWYPNSQFGNWGVQWPMWDHRPMYQYTSMLIHPQDNKRMMMGTFPQGIYLSADGGTTWQESNNGWTNDGVFCLVSHPEQKETVFAGTYNGINVSYDFGQNWEKYGDGWPGEQWVFSIDFDPFDADIMYAVSKNGENMGRGSELFKGVVMKSIDGGANWFEITAGLDKEQEFYQIICDRKQAGVLYLATQRDGIYRSEDYGNTWQDFSEGLIEKVSGSNGNNVVNTFEMSADNSVLYFGTNTMGVFRRMLVPILPIRYINALPQDDGIVIQWDFEDLAGNIKQYNIYRSSEPIVDINDADKIAFSTAIDLFEYKDTTVEELTPYYYAITSEATDGSEAETYPTVGPVSYRSYNTPPHISHPIADTIAECHSLFAFNFRNAFADDDGDTLSFSIEELGQTGLPNWLSHNDTLLVGEAENSDRQALEIVITATDKYQASINDTFLLQVLWTVEQASVSLDETGKAKLTWVFPQEDYFEDVHFHIFRDYNPISELTDLEPIEVLTSSDANTWVDQSVVNNGEYYYAIRAYYHALDYATRSFKSTDAVSITTANNPPQINDHISDQSILQTGEAFVLIPDVMFTDSDDDQLYFSSYALGQDTLPAWLHFVWDEGYYFTEDERPLGDYPIVIEAMDDYDSYARDTFILTVKSGDEPNAIAENLELNIIIAPNPNEGLLSIAASDAVGDYRITLYDMAMKRVFDQSIVLASGQTTLCDVSHLESGVYWLFIRANDGKVVVKQFIKQ